MTEYIKKAELIKKLCFETAEWYYSPTIKTIKEFPAADVQPLSVVAEHIKKRLYETAFDTNELIAREAITDIAERIDFWIDELKEGEHND